MTDTSVVRLDEIITSPLAGDGVHWSLEADAELNVNLAHLDAGSSVAGHANDSRDVAVVVLAGSGRLRVDAIDHDLSRHVLALVPRGSERTIAAGPDGLTYLTVHHRRGPLGITSKEADVPEWRT